MSLTDLIPAQFRLLAAGGIALVLLLGGAAAGWTANGWRLGKDVATLKKEHAEQLAKDSQVATAAFREQQQARQKLEGTLAELDQTSTKELTDAQAENERLRRLYSAADGERKRLRIEVNRASAASAEMRASASPGSVGDAATVELSERSGQAVWDIRAEMSADQAKIRYLHGYVCQIRPETPGCSPVGQ